MDIFRLDGKRALVTGGSKGIGLGIARRMAEAGASLAIAARTQADLDAAVESCSEFGGEVRAFRVDLAQPESLAAAYDAIAAECGPVDILVNNAGITRRAPAQDLTLEDWDEVLTVNLKSVFALSQAFARERIASGRGGRIVNVASLMSEASRPTTSAYTASKGGIRQLTKALAVDWAPHGITVNAVGPGYIATPLTQTLRDDPDFDAWVKKRTPLGRWGEPDDLGCAALFLASDAARFITGQILYVDGGWLATF